MVEPQYQELLEKDIPHVSKDGVHVAVIAGSALGTSVSTSNHKVYLCFLHCIGKCLSAFRFCN